MDILFDLDGTLIDTWDLYLECYLRTLEPYLGRRPSFAELRALHPTSELRALTRALGPGRAPAAHREFLAHYQALHASVFAGVYPGVLDALEALRRAGATIGVVTGKSRAAWDITRALVPLGEFALFVGDEDVAEPKPSPEGLQLALRRLGSRPADAVYVGDSVNDALAARAAGIRFVAATWAKSRDELPGFLERVRGAGVWAELPQPGALLGLLDGRRREPVPDSRH